MKSISKTTVNFEWTSHHKNTALEITFKVKAVVYFGTAGFTASDGVYEPGEPDDAEILSVIGPTGFALPIQKMSDLLYQEIKEAAIERAYAEQEVFEAAY